MFRRNNAVLDKKVHTARAWKFYPNNNYSDVMGNKYAQYSCVAFVDSPVFKKPFHHKRMLCTGPNHDCNKLFLKKIYKTFAPWSYHCYLPNFTCNRLESLKCGRYLCHTQYNSILLNICQFKYCISVVSWTANTSVYTNAKKKGKRNSSYVFRHRNCVRRTLLAAQLLYDINNNNKKKRKKKRK